VLEVELAGYGSVVRGYGSRELVARVTNRPPVYIPAVHGWSVQESTAADVVAAAERAGYDVVITGPRASGLCHAVTQSETGTVQRVGQSDPETIQGLW
jgi:hypothetical protein